MTIGLFLGMFLRSSWKSSTVYRYELDMGCRTHIEILESFRVILHATHELGRVEFIRFQRSNASVQRSNARSKKIENQFEFDSSRALVH